MTIPSSIKDRFTERALQVLKAVEARPAPSLKVILQEIYYAKGSVGSNFLRSHGLKEVDVQAIREDQRLAPQQAYREVIFQAVKAAVSFQHNLLGTHHLLYGFFQLAKQEETLRRFFNEFAAPISRLQRDLKALLLADSRFPDWNDLDISSLSGPGFQGLVQDNGDYEDLSSSADDIEQELETMHDHSLIQFKRSSQRQDLGRKSQHKLWDQFGVELTSEAKKGRLDPLIGREQELERVIQILGRRTKSNPVLIGEAGVGKTAIVYGLAQRIAQEEVPQNLLGKKIYDLRLSQLVAGTVFRGEFEARLEAILKAAKNDEVILFIDEIHQLIGAGSASGSLDAAGILKPPLAKGEIQVIGATTLDEYRQYIEADKALARRFQPVYVKEPDTQLATQVLLGLKDHYEKYHGLKITRSALKAAVELSQRYITDRRLPDKALDLIDEAAVRAKTLAGLSENRKRLRQLQQQLEKLEQIKSLEIDKGAYDKAFQVKQEQKKLEQEIRVLEQAVKQEEGARQVTVSGQDVKEVVARMTGIPLAKLTVSERRQLDHLEEVLARYIIGQDQVIKQLATTIRRSRAGLSPENRPLGSFIFMGPTGVGKTETCKVLAREVFGPDALIKLDMSEFMEPHTVSRLLGAPAGYVGYGEGGELTEKVWRQPYSLVLFDEIEKAHPRVYNILLQILEDGRLTDAMGREVDFRNTIVVLTSNIGTSEFTKKGAEIGFLSGSKQAQQKAQEEYQRIKERSLKELRQLMKPELLNRLDGVLVFRPLSRQDIVKIVHKQLLELQKRLQQEKKIRLEWSDKVPKFLGQAAFNPQRGARPVRRIIQDKIENVLAQKLIRGELRPGGTIRFTLLGQKLEAKTD